MLTSIFVLEYNLLQLERYTYEYIIYTETNMYWFTNNKLDDFYDNLVHCLR